MLGRVFDAVRHEDRKSKRSADYKERRSDFIFHMTDWLTDLRELQELYAHPTKVEVQKVSISLMSILIHVIPHLNAAGRLLLDEDGIGDPFAEPTQRLKGKSG